MNIEKEQKAIERLKAFEPPDGYYLAYSGGKDSDAILILAKLAGAKAILFTSADLNALVVLGVLWQISSDISGLQSTLSIKITISELLTVCSTAAAN